MKTFLSLVFALFLTLTLACSDSQAKKRSGVKNDTRPNVVVITTDDLDMETYEAVPELRAMLDAQGVAFDNSFVTNPLCCPSRATFLRGQYAHNTGVMTNIPPFGGYERYSELGRHRNDLPVWLSRSGYRTGFFGKYMNGYGNDPVPPGFDRFHMTGYGDRYREGDVWKTYPPGAWRDDVATNRATGFIANQRKVRGPFFAWVSLMSPHADIGGGGYDVPARHSAENERNAAVEPMDEKPSRDYDLTGKPGWVQENARYSEENPPDLASDYEDRVRMMRGTADNVRSIIDSLRRSGQLADTYIIFTSDNGYMMGEHGIRPSKLAPYEESVRVPLIVRGPGVPKGERREGLVANNDLAPTILHYAKTRIPAFVDGRSLKSQIAGAQSGRKRLLIEHMETGESQFGNPGPTSYEMLRDERYAYIEYESGERELYDMTTDPHQMTNLAEDDPALTAGLSEELAALAGCRAEGCRAAENVP